MAEERPTTPEAIWNEGDFRKLSGGLVIVSELLCEAVELHALEKVLDVGTGDGNTALAAARRRAAVVGVDSTETLLEHAKVRAQTEGLKIDFHPDNAEHLHFPDGSFDVVMSTFGVCFVGNPEAAARQLARVCRPGGRIALANWTDRGYTGELFRLIEEPIRRAGLNFDPLRWGRPEQLEELFGSSVKTLRFDRHERKFRADSVESLIEGTEKFLGPVATALKYVSGNDRERLERRIRELVQRHNTAHDGTFLGVSEYLEYIGERSSR